MTCSNCPEFPRTASARSCGTTRESFTSFDSAGQRYQLGGGADLQAFNVSVRIEERESILLGLDAPSQLNVMMGAPEEAETVFIGTRSLALGGRALPGFKGALGNQ